MSDTIILKWIQCFFIVFCGSLHFIRPKLYVKNVFFGVVVDPEFADDEDMHRIIRVYRWIIVLLTGIFGIGVFFIPDNPLMSLGLLLLFTFLSFVIALICRNRLKKIRDEKGIGLSYDKVEVDLASQDNRHRFIPLLHHLPPLLWSIGILWMLYKIYPELPDVIPTHYDLYMNPDVFSPKTLFNVTGAGWIFTGIILMNISIHFSIIRSKSRFMFNKSFSRTTSEKSSPKGWGFIRILSSYFVAVIDFSLAAPLTGSLSRKTIMVMALGATALYLLLFFIIILGMSGKKTDDGTGEYGRQDEKYWKGGFIYYNKEDPVLWVPQRLGIGHTINMAHPMGKLIVAAFIGFLILQIFFIGKII